MKARMINATTPSTATPAHQSAINHNSRRARSVKARRSMIALFADLAPEHPVGIGGIGEDDGDQDRRPDEKKWDELIQRQTRVIERTVKAATPSGGFDFGDITLVTALGYLNFRLPDLDWQSIRPDLVDWMQNLASRPSVELTRPDAA